jgi:hypothetical protein
MAQEHQVTCKWRWESNYLNWLNVVFRVLNWPWPRVNWPWDCISATAAWKVTEFSVREFVCVFLSLLTARSFVKGTDGLEDNIKMVLKGMHRIYLAQNRDQVRVLWTRLWTFGFHKRREISWPAERLSASEGELCSTDLMFCADTRFREKSYKIRFEHISRLRLL